MTMYNLWTLIKYEYKKLFQRKAVWIVTLTLMAMAAASVILPPFMSVVSSNSGSDDSYTAYDSYKAQQELAADLKGRPLDDDFAKLFTAVTFSIGAVLLLFLTTAVSSFAIYGTEGFNAQIQLSAIECTWGLTIGQGVLIMLGISIAAAVMLSCTGLFLAEFFRSSLPAMGILIGFLLISSILNIPEQFRVLSQIWSYCPTNLISLTGGLMEHRLVPFFGTYLTSYQAGPFIYLILALLSAFGGYFVWRRWQAGGR